MSRTAQDSTGIAIRGMTRANLETYQAATKSPMLPVPEKMSARAFAQPVSARDSALLPHPLVRAQMLVASPSTTSLTKPRGLRRKPSTIEQYAAARRQDMRGDVETTLVQSSKDDETKSLRKTRSRASPSPHLRTVSNQAATNHTATLPHISPASGNVLTRDLESSMPPYAPSRTPSTRYTDSPFSHAPTPSSASSHDSAAAVRTGSFTSGLQEHSPIRSRPPVATRAAKRSEETRLGLVPVRESSTSSSDSIAKTKLTFREVQQGAGQIPNMRQEANSSYAEHSVTQARPVNARSTQDLRTLSGKAQVQRPPELAHLDMQFLSRPSLYKAPPPVRPSRDGTSNMSGMNKGPTVVQSDLSPLYTTYHKRTPSQETPTSASTPNFKARFGLSPRGSSRGPSPCIDSAISPPQEARVLARSKQAHSQPSDQGAGRRDSPAIVSNPVKSPRFGFLSRKTKIEPSKPLDKPVLVRRSSKGPAAGTGHEGYGRYATRARSGSSSSSAGVQSPSDDSLSSQQWKRQPNSRKSSAASKDFELDDFLRERLKPVILRGSGSTCSNYRSGNETQASSQPASSSLSSLGSNPQPQLLPSAFEHKSGVAIVHKRRVPSDSSEDDVAARYPAATARRSSIPSRQDNRKGDVKLPAHLKTRPPSQPALVNGEISERSLGPRGQDTVATNKGNESSCLQPSFDEQISRPSRKWNFWQRARAPLEIRTDGQAPDYYHTSHSIDRPISGFANPHYALLGAVQPLGLEDVERLAYENDTSHGESASENGANLKMVPQKHPLMDVKSGYDQHDAQARVVSPLDVSRMDLTESPELLRARSAVHHKSPSVIDIQRAPAASKEDITVGFDEPWTQPGLGRPRDSHTPELTPTLDEPSHNSPQRQPRLSPVGRIPPVISKRDRDRKLADLSFSRPFVRTQPKPPGSLYTQIRNTASPVEGGSQPASSTSTHFNKGLLDDQKDSETTNTSSTCTKRTSLDLFSQGEFFSMTNRKGSEISYSSISSNNSMMTSLTAVHPQVEDVWNEYNDLLYHGVLNRSPTFARYSFGAPFRDSDELLPAAIAPAIPAQTHAPPTTSLPSPPRTKTIPAIPSVQEQVSRLLQPSLSPLITPRASEAQSRGTSIPPPSQTSTPRVSHLKSFRDVSLGMPKSSGASLPRSSTSSLAGTRASMISSARHSRSSGHSRSASLPEADARNSQSSLTTSVRFKRDAQLLNIAEARDNDQGVVAADLRFAAVMTSKCLSNGHILFSPARNEMRLSAEPRVLIIDGLGSDWSYYVALEYPSAMIYDLGPAPVNGISAWPGVTQMPPSNHRHITHDTSAIRFPFPKGFFTAAVFRFPAANTEQAYQAYISECKRVLRPGGYIEVVAVDLDLANMGNKARKEIRGLKTRMQQQQPSISLRNLSDQLVNMIGRRGFESCQRCVVNVPAAGQISISQDGSSLSSDSVECTIEKADRVSRALIFADLLLDSNASGTDDGSKVDAKLTQTMAKVGRMWYSACYEKMFESATNNSIWQDRGLLRECEKQGTTFRLLICHAQKPLQPRRRTVSV